MSWILLIIGGLFEVGFASCLGKANETKELNLLIGWAFTLSKYIYCCIKQLKNYLLVQLMVWTGIVGTVLVGIVVFKEPATFENFF
jgi:quaternary ammonium compound-resistance protein SugE